MSLRDEAKENLAIVNETLFNGALREYRFDGINGPLIAIHGAGLSGWTKDGIRSFMPEYNVRGVLKYVGILTKGIDSYLPLLDEEVRRYPRPTLVGFSTGGFIVLRYAEKYGWENVKNIVTIATPFGGNLEKYKAFGKSIEETTAGSPLLNEIVNLNPPIGIVTSVFASEDVHTPDPLAFGLNWEKVITGAKSHGDIQNHQKWYDNILKHAIGIS